MPNVDELLDEVSQIVTANTAGTLYFTVLDLKYAYSQVTLNAQTAKQCKLNIVGGQATGTYVSNRVLRISRHACRISKSHGSNTKSRKKDFLLSG